MQKKQIFTLSLLAVGFTILVAINASLMTERQVYAKFKSKPTLASTIDISNASAQKPSAGLLNSESGSGVTGSDGVIGSGSGGFTSGPTLDVPPGEPADSASFAGADTPSADTSPSDTNPPASSEQFPSLGNPSGGYPAPGSGAPSGSSAPSGSDAPGPSGSSSDWGGTGGFQGDNAPALPTLPPDTNPVAYPTDVVIPTQPPVTIPTVPAAQPPTATQPPAAPSAPTQPPAVQPTATHTPAQPTSAPVTPTQLPAAPTPAQPPAAGALISIPAGSAPKVDGAADDPAWASAPALTVTTSGGANHSATTVTVKSIYDGKRVYFLLTWADPTDSILRQPWQKQADGSWKRLVGAQNAGSDETEFYEDKLAFFWPIQNSVPNFNTQGCGGLCHTGENGKPYGNMYTAGSHQRVDLWQMKAVRGAGQVDDQYLDNQAYTKQTPSAGFHPDPSTGGGYRENQTKDKSAPAYMLPGTSATSDKSGAPGFISEAAKVALKASLFKPGDRVPSVLTAPFEGDRGDITGAWRYGNGAWTLELSRARVTGSPYDVQFDDLSHTYAFALATFDNAQQRHAVQSGATLLKFQR